MSSPPTPPAIAWTGPTASPSILQSQSHKAQDQRTTTAPLLIDAGRRCSSIFTTTPSSITSPNAPPIGEEHELPIQQHLVDSWGLKIARIPTQSPPFTNEATRCAPPMIASSFEWPTPTSLSPDSCHPCTCCNHRQAERPTGAKHSQDVSQEFGLTYSGSGFDEWDEHYTAWASPSATFPCATHYQPFLNLTQAAFPPDFPSLAPLSIPLQCLLSRLSLFLGHMSIYIDLQQRLHPDEGMIDKELVIMSSLKSMGWSVQQLRLNPPSSSYRVVENHSFWLVSPPSGTVFSTQSPWMDMDDPCNDDQCWSRLEELCNFVIDFRFADLFSVARPVPAFEKLWLSLRHDFVGTLEELRGAISTFSSWAEQSLEQRGMAIPPWRTAHFLEACFARAIQHRREIQMQWDCQQLPLSFWDDLLMMMPSAIQLQQSLDCQLFGGRRKVSDDADLESEWDEEIMFAKQPPHASEPVSLAC